MWIIGGINWKRKGVGLYFLVDFIGHYIDFVENSFEVSFLLLAGLGGAEFFVYFIFYIFFCE